MSATYDSTEDEIKQHNVEIHVDDLSNGNTIKLSPAASIESITCTVSHITVPTPTVNDSHSSNSSINAQSTTVLDVEDGVGRATKRIVNKSYKKLRENIFLSVLIAIVFGIFITPVILYYTRPDINNPFTNTTLQSSCPQVCTAYTSHVCGDVLRENSQLLHFNNQDMAESNLSAIFNITSLSQDCGDNAKTFFCNATYHSCNDAMHMPSTKECEQLQNDTCSSQWMQIQNISSTLTDCSIYNRPVERTCPSQFRMFCDDICVPLCSEFSQNSEGATTVVTVVTGVLSNSVNFLGGILVFVIAFFKGKPMFQFPQVLILYTTATISVTVIFITAAYFGADVLCSDDNLFVALSNPTAYCKIYGFAYQAGVLIFSGFWLLFVSHLYLKLVFPIHSRKFDAYEHRSKIYVVEIISVLFIGILIPAIVVGTSEYSIVNFPPTQCAANNVEVTFYTLIFPTILLQFIGIILILLSFCSIHRRKGIFKTVKSNKRKCIEFTTPEIKLLLIFLYFTLILCVYWASFCVQLRNRNGLFAAIFDYVTCVNDIDHPERDCEVLREEIYTNSFPGLDVAATLMTSLVNFSSVVFVLQVKDVKKRLRTLTRRFTSRNSMENASHSQDKSEAVNQPETTKM